MSSTTLDLWSERIGLGAAGGCLVEGGEWIYHVRARDLQGELSSPSTGVLITVAASGGGSDLPAAPEGVRQATK